MDIAEEAVEISFAEALKPEEIRWFYKDGVDKRWIEFCGYDSLRIENAWRKKSNIDNTNDDDDDNNETVVVKGGMYDVELNNMKCVSIYWPGNFISFIHFIILLYYLVTYYYYYFVQTQIKGEKN